MSGHNGNDFTVDQKRYLEGFVSGVQAARVAKSLIPIPSAPANGQTAAKGSAPSPGPMGPDAAHLAAKDRFVAAPAQDSFMCRLRIPNGILDAWQLRGIAGLAERHGGGYAHITRMDMPLGPLKPFATP